MSKFDPIALLQSVLDKDFDLTIFRQVDESHFPLAPNFFEFITGRDYCNATILPWQVEASMHLFSEYCPVCSDPEYLTELFAEPMEEIRDRITFLEHGVCPKCHQTKLDMFTLGEFHPSKPSMKSELIAVLGQRSGKSKEVNIASAYQLHRWCKIPDPIEFYGLPRMELVLGTYSALSDGQAEENLWIPFRGLYDSAPWFQKYNDFLKKEQKRLSIPLIDIKDTYIFYVHKRFFMTFTGADDRKKRGRTRLFGAIDEIAYLNTDKKTSKIMDADKNYAALNNSLSTIRKKAINLIRKSKDPNVMMPVMYNASSPLNVQDKSWKLLKGAPTNAWSHAMHRATWEANPDYTQEDCRSINQGISEVEFQRDFGAIPPFSENPYIGDSRPLLKLCKPLPANTKPVMEATRDIWVDQMGDKYLILKAQIPRPERMIPRLLSLDNGFKNNAFAACMFHWDVQHKRPVLDFAVNMYPEPDAKLYVNFPAMFEHFILPIVKNFRVEDIFFDRWQSLDQIQRLRNMKKQAEAYTLSYEKDFLPFKQELINGNMQLPPCEIDIDAIKDIADPLSNLKQAPIATLIWQTLTVREVGRKVIKPLDGDDDLFRAFVLGGSRFLLDDMKRKYERFHNVMTNQNGTMLGRTYSFGQQSPNRPNEQSKTPFAVSRGFSKRR